MGVDRRWSIYYHLMSLHHAYPCRQALKRSSSYRQLESLELAWKLELYLWNSLPPSANRHLCSNPWNAISQTYQWSTLSLQNRIDSMYSLWDLRAFTMSVVSNYGEELKSSERSLCRHVDPHLAHKFLSYILGSTHESQTFYSWWTTLTPNFYFSPTTCPLQGSLVYAKYIMNLCTNEVLARRSISMTFSWTLRGALPWWAAMLASSSSSYSRTGITTQMLICRALLIAHKSSDNLSLFFHSE